MMPQQCTYLTGLREIPGLLTVKEYFNFVGRNQIVKNSLGNVRKLSGKSQQRLSHLLQEKRKGKTSGSFTEIKYFVLWMGKWMKSDDICLEEYLNMDCIFDGFLQQHILRQRALYEDLSGNTLNQNQSGSKDTGLDRGS